MTERQRRILELRKEHQTRAAMALELRCSVATVARELAALRRLFELPPNLMTIDTRRAVEVMREAETAGRIDADGTHGIRSPGALALKVYKSLDPDARALVRPPSLAVLANAIRRSRSTAHRTVQRQRGADKIRDELRMALNAVVRARRLLEDDDWQASEAAWAELDSLAEVVDDVVRRAEDPNYSPARAALDALASD